MENREVAVCRLDFEISIATTDVLLVQEISVKKGEGPPQRLSFDFFWKVHHVMPNTNR